MTDLKKDEKPIITPPKSINEKPIITPPKSINEKPIMTPPKSKSINEKPIMTPPKSKSINEKPIMTPPKLKSTDEKLKKERKVNTANLTDKVKKISIQLAELHAEVSVVLIENRTRALATIESALRNSDFHLSRIPQAVEKLAKIESKKPVGNLRKPKTPKKRKK